MAENVKTSPWKNYDLQSMTIPDEAKTAAAGFKTVSSMVPMYSGDDKMETFVLTVTPSVNNKSEMTFLFLHGASFTASTWDQLGTMSLLGALGYKSVAIDIPGDLLAIIVPF